MVKGVKRRDYWDMETPELTRAGHVEQAAGHSIEAALALRPEEVAAALVWLAGPGSSGMTGAVVPVDGGLAL